MVVPLDLYWTDCIAEYGLRKAQIRQKGRNELGNERHAFQPCRMTWNVGMAWPWLFPKILKYQGITDRFFLHHAYSTHNWSFHNMMEWMASSRIHLYKISMWQNSSYQCLFVWFSHKSIVPPVHNPTTFCVPLLSWTSYLPGIVWTWSCLMCGLNTQ